MTTIRYDTKVQDFISALNLTENVTHNSYKKTSVTFHGTGDFSHEYVLDEWASRKISMHFMVDVAGEIAQYVKADEYAWAVGNHRGNEESIHIELALVSGKVSDTTLKSAARLAGWLFVHVIDDHPARDTVFTHEHWSQVACLGSFDVYNLFLEEIQGWYIYFRNQQKAPTTFEVVDLSKETIEQIKKIQDIFGMDQTGAWDADMDRIVLEFRRKCLRR